MSAPLKMTQRDLEAHEFKGLEDHETHLLRCSACGEALLEVKVVKPKTPVTLQYQADCPHCGDHSFPLELKGEVLIGHTAKVTWTATDMQGSKATLHTTLNERKGKSDE